MVLKMFIKIEKLYLFLSLTDIQEFCLLKKEFAGSFVNSDVVLLCPIYAAGEKKNFKFKKIEFAKLISKFSKTQVILIKDFNEIGKYMRKNLISDEIIIGMGAGSISKHMRELKNNL